MKKIALGTAFITSALIMGCTGSGFNVKLIAESISSPTDTSKSHDESSSPNAAKSGNGGDISLGGILLTEKNGSVQLDSHLQISSSYKTIQSSDLSYLDGIEIRNDYIQLGCNANSTSIRTLSPDLQEAKIDALNTTDSFAIKARVVLICGKLNLPFAFVSIVADQVNLSDVSYELAPSTGVGFFAIYANAIQLMGTNQITALGENSPSLVLKDPSLTVMARKSIEGPGILNLTTTGGEVSATPKSK